MNKLPSKEEKTIRVGSRKSELAIIQTKHVISRLQQLYHGNKFEIHTMLTIGDRVLNTSLPKIGEKSLFTRDLEDALRSGGVDFVVHSLKDLPTSLPPGMAIGAVLEREDARDALVLRKEYKGYTICTLPQGSVIGTSSLRRAAQVKRKYPHLVVCDIRGNLNTRLAKLDALESKFAGIILAQAGLIRMGWMNRINQILEPTSILYAVGQGALAVECRANDEYILTMLQNLMCVSTTCRILAERSFLKTLGGGCSAPIAVCSNLHGEVCNNNKESSLSLIGAVWSLDGETEIREKLTCSFVNNVNLDVAHKTKFINSYVDEPPQKRLRRDDRTNANNKEQSIPPIINDGIDIGASFDVNEFIVKHISLVNKCSVVNTISKKNSDSSKAPANVDRGGGDADIGTTSNCPLHINIGQDFMGQCPFVDEETKVSLGNSTFDASNEVHSTKSNCLFTLKSCNEQINTKNMYANAQEKCPFLQKAVQMFDYDNEEKRLPHFVDIENVDNLFCGLYQHSCFSNELFAKCDKLGQQLAKLLISKGALDLMKIAQAEIHGNQ